MKLEDIREMIKSYENTIESQVFCDVSIDMLKCYDLNFLNCKFINVNFKNNNYEMLEIEKCEFIQCVFEETWNDILLNCKECYFVECIFQNIVLVGYDEQSEIIDSRFEKCIFKDIKVESDLSIFGINFNFCEVDSLKGKMNLCFENQISETVFRNIHLDVTIKKSKFNKVSFQNILLEGIAEENLYEDCEKINFL